MHPYIFFRSCRYINFTLFSTRTFSCIWDSTRSWCPQISLQYLWILTYLMGCQRWGMPQGHQKFPHLFLRVHQLWGWLTGLPVKLLVRIPLFWVCSISGVIHLCTSSLLVLCSIFLLLCWFHEVLISYVVLWGCQGSVPPLPSGLPIVCILYTWLLPFSLHAYWWTSWLSSVWTSHPRLVFHAMHKIFFLLPSAGELGVIFIPLRLNFEALRTFP